MDLIRKSQTLSKMHETIGGRSVVHTIWQTVANGAVRSYVGPPIHAGKGKVTG